MIMEPVQFLATSGFHFFLCLTGLAWTQRQPPRIPWNITTIIYFIINRYKLGSITLQHHHDHRSKPRREEEKSNSRFNNFPIVLSNSVPHQSEIETLINDIHTPPLQFCFWQKLNAFSGVYFHIYVLPFGIWHVLVPNSGGSPVPYSQGDDE